MESLPDKLRARQQPGSGGGKPRWRGGAGQQQHISVNTLPVTGQVGTDIFQCSKYILQ